jgi:hypothetical protein
VASAEVVLVLLRERQTLPQLMEQQTPEVVVEAELRVRMV